MERKRVRKRPGKTKIHVTLRNLDDTPKAAFRAREPEHTATFWRNTYELERRTREAQIREVKAVREENDRLRAEIERLTKPRKLKKRLP